MKVKSETWQQKLLAIRHESRPKSDSQSQTMLQLKEVSFNYPGQKYFEGIRQVSLNVKEGEVLAIAGRSGSGKTTLLKCIYGLFDLAEGKITMQGEEVLGPAYNLMPGHRNMQLVSQEYYVLVNHTVQENFYDKLQHLTYEDRAKRGEQILRLLELQHLRNTRAADLSSGQKQRVAIGRALAVFPDLLLLDEPFSNIDNLLSEKLFSFIMREAKKNKCAVILITHLPEEALKYSQHLAIMDKGRILQRGDTWDVYYRPKNSKLAGLLGDFNTIRKEDLERGSPYRSKKTVYVRPDKIKIAPAGKKPDIVLQVNDCYYNGKCVEIIGNTHSGKSVRVYSAKKLFPGTKAGFVIEQ